MADRLQVDSSQFVASVGRERPSAQENSPVFEVPVSYPSAGEGVDLMVQPETLQGSSPHNIFYLPMVQLRRKPVLCQVLVHRPLPRQIWDFSEIMLMAEG